MAISDYAPVFGEIADVAAAPLADSNAEEDDYRLALRAIYKGCQAAAARLAGPLPELVPAQSPKPRLRQLRNASRQTQQQIADFLGVERVSIRRWENGREPIPPAYVGRLVELFGVSAPFLLGEVF
jgi:phytoene dehydrogenase-like protein